VVAAVEVDVGVDRRREPREVDVVEQTGAVLSRRRSVSSWLVQFAAAEHKLEVAYSSTSIPP
jgi:hypothetical protein